MNVDKEYICPVCNKVFDTHGYKSYLYKKVVKGKTQVYCSWTCMHKAEIEIKGDKFRRSMNGY